MTFTNAVPVPFPLDEVWRWFTAPGAMTRLTPPFMGMRVVQEADDVRAGVAKLRPALPSPAPKLPTPTWVATHDPEGYAERERFVDRVTSSPYRQLVAWEHVHEFEDVGDGTRIVDRVSARVPRGPLESMFAFRSSRIVADLEAMARARAYGDGGRRTIAVTGSSGLIGTQLCAWLTAAGHRVIRLVRSLPEGPDERRWDPDAPASDLLDDVDALIHLAGHTIADRFTEGHKRKLRDSRIDPTAKLAELVAARQGRTTLVCGSAVGYYGADRGEEWLDEDAPPGTDFLADVVRDWEAACEPARDVTRVVNIRTGVVLSAAGGVLGVLSPLFRLGLGGRIGDGRQWFAWIALDDVVDVYVRAALDPTVSGPVNAVAPQILRNADYTRILGDVLRRPTPIPVPELAPTLLLGREGNDQLAAANQRVRPAALERMGHHFRFPDLASALRHELGREHRR
ncbi:MAG: TIGR01777 family protein [Propionibacterium sp.]|nr:TIGR01777 family protein [Propionibacterium sp.]